MGATRGSPVDIGISELFGASPARNVDYVREFAVKLEELGFESLWVPEHIVFFDTYESRYPYNETGTLALGSEPGVFDPFATLTAAGLATTSLKLGTSILLLGERNPLITAREAATVDQFTAGRLLLGVGVGWSHEEYAALGVPWERRGPRCDEYIDVVKRLWTTDRTSFKGEFCEFDGVAAYPKPVQSPHPPVLIGGNTRPALRRAARRGDGWFGWNLDHDELRDTIAELDQLLAAEGRSRDGFVVQIGRQETVGPEEAAAYARGCQPLGVDRLVLAVPTSRRAFGDQLGQYAGALGL
jgi:probable F420-dependent oxidoreductase